VYQFYSDLPNLVKFGDIYDLAPGKYYGYAIGPLSERDSVLLRSPDLPTKEGIILTKGALIQTEPRGVIVPTIQQVQDRPGFGFVHVIAATRPGEIAVAPDRSIYIQEGSVVVTVPAPVTLDLNVAGRARVEFSVKSMSVGETCSWETFARTPSGTYSLNTGAGIDLVGQAFTESEPTAERLRITFTMETAGPCTLAYSVVGID